MKDPYAVLSYASSKGKEGSEKAGPAEVWSMQQIQFRKFTGRLKNILCPAEKEQIFAQGTGLRSLGTGGVKICTKASMWQSLLNSISEGGEFDFIVIFSYNREACFYFISHQLSDLLTEIKLVYSHFINL